MCIIIVACWCFHLSFGINVKATFFMILAHNPKWLWFYMLWYVKCFFNKTHVWLLWAHCFRSNFNFPHTRCKFLLRNFTLKWTKKKIKRRSGTIYFNFIIFMKINRSQFFIIFHFAWRTSTGTGTGTNAN